MNSSNSRCKSRSAVGLKMSNISNGLVAASATLSNGDERKHTLRNHLIERLLHELRRVRSVEHIAREELLSRVTSLHRDRQAARIVDLLLRLSVPEVQLGDVGHLCMHPGGR